MGEFSKLLQKAREKKGLTKSAAAAIFGWSAMYYARYENHNLLPTRMNYAKFAKFLGITVKELERIIEQQRCLSAK